MKLNIDSFVNIHFNEPCLLLGPSPSMGNFNFDKFSGKIITFGDTIIRGNNLFKADYWIASNNEFPLPHYHFDLINSLKATFIFSDSALYDNLWTKNDKFLEKKLLVNWANYDERHFKGEECKPKKKCCELLKEKPDRKTIQEIVSQKFDSKITVSQGYTVAEYGLCFALIMGCNPIYIQGVDLPLMHKDYTYYPSKEADKITIEAKKYVSECLIKNKKNKTMKFIRNLSKIINNFLFDDRKIIHNPTNYFGSLFYRNNQSVFFNDVDKIIKNFDDYANIASNKNIKIYNLSQFSNLNKCKNIKYYDYKII